MKRLLEHLAAWQVKNQTALESRSEALLSGGILPPVVGREEAIDLLLLGRRKAAKGACVVLLAGEAGAILTGWGLPAGF